MCCVVWFFFFFKQKTAYEMRISDWSSDVCSSDLFGLRGKDGTPGKSGTLGNKAFGMMGSAIMSALDQPDRPSPETSTRRQYCPQIGRASCRERVCQYV